MTMDKNRYLLATAAPGVLDGWCGPILLLVDEEWRDGVLLTNGTAQSGGFYVPDCPGHRVLLDTHRPEVRDHLVRHGYAIHGCSAWASLRNSPRELLVTLRSVVEAYRCVRGGS
jgi:hypothetical protein